MTSAGAAFVAGAFLAAAAAVGAGAAGLAGAGFLAGSAAEAANEALGLLHAEFLWRFELLRSRQRQPSLIIPEPLPPSAAICQSNA